MKVIGKEKILMFDIRQPFAHYREPKVMQDNFIPTLHLPPATTIAGMVSYLIDRRVKSKFRIGVVGTYRNKTVDFIRGEGGEFVKKYELLIKKNYKKLVENDKMDSFKIRDYYDYSKKTIGNRIMHVENLQEVRLKIFFSCEDNELVKSAFENPSKYISLGRKEDFAIGAKKGELVKEIEIEKVKIADKKDAIRNDLLFKNTYIPVELQTKDEEKKEEVEKILSEGVLYSLPKIYQNLESEKKDRVVVNGHYVYLNEHGAYLGNREANVYSFVNDKGEKEKLVFNWLT